MARCVDLNADLGERDTFTEFDAGVVAAVTSVSIACGFHAGSADVMRDTASACLQHEVTIGAHVSYRDRANFGRRAVEVPRAQLVADIEEQIAILATAIAEVGAGIAYVKPHGALYNAMGTNPSVAEAVLEAVSRQAHPVLVAQPASVVTERARAAGMRTVFEGFPDRGYLPDGRLVPRDRPGAMVTDPVEVGRRACSLAVDGGVAGVDGTWTDITVDTLCVHGDTPDADRRARAVRAALESSGVSIRAFATAVPHPAAG